MKSKNLWENKDPKKKQLERPKRNTNLRRNKTNICYRTRGSDTFDSSMVKIIHRDWIVSLSSNDFVLTSIISSFELAQIPFFLDQLNMMMLAIKLTLMSYVIRRTYSAASMCTLEATLVVQCPIHRHLHKVHIVSSHKLWNNVAVSKILMFDNKL